MLRVMARPRPVPAMPAVESLLTRETIHLAAQLGMGALTFAFIDEHEARQWVRDYYQTFER